MYYDIIIVNITAVTYLSILW